MAQRTLQFSTEDASLWALHDSPPPPSSHVLELRRLMHYAGALITTGFLRVILCFYKDHQGFPLVDIQAPTGNTIRMQIQMGTLG